MDRCLALGEFEAAMLPFAVLGHVPAVLQNSIGHFAAVMSSRAAVCFFRCQGKDSKDFAIESSKARQ